MHSILVLTILICLIGWLLSYTPYGQAWPRHAPNGLGGLALLLIVLFFFHVI
jgi:hypothetical protein